MGPHHQHRLGACARRLALQIGLCRRQARHCRPDQDGRARNRDLRHHRNAICPGYVWTPLVEKQIPETMAARGLTSEQVINDVLLHAQPTKQFVTSRGGRGAGACSSPAIQARSITGVILPIDGGWTAQ
jgi:NAD(P)-dependent dehydrogenase (short-subunit alcohol dehydrogenase family)